MKSSSYVVALVVLVSAAGCGSSTPTSPGTVAVNAPVPEAPIGDAQLDTLRPTLVVRNASSSATGTRTYDFQISDSPEFTPVLVSQSGVAEGGATTSFTPASDLPSSTRMYWRARVLQGGSASAWSSTAQFRTQIGGFNRGGALFDPLTNGQTIGERVGSITDMGAHGMRVGSANSWIKYQLAATITTGEISVEVEGLAPNNRAASRASSR